MQVREVMSQPVVSVELRTTVRKAAALLRRHDIGALPVLKDDRPVGIVTDRDIVIGLMPEPDDAGEQPVSAAMSSNPVSFFEDRTVAEAAALMGDQQIGRLLVVDRSNRLVGMLSISDIAVNVSEELAGQALGEICEER